VSELLFVCVFIIADDVLFPLPLFHFTLLTYVSLPSQAKNDHTPSSNALETVHSAQYGYAIGIPPSNKEFFSLRCNAARELVLNGQANDWWR
jgi:hypothetical protein